MHNRKIDKKFATLIEKIFAFWKTLKKEYSVDNIPFTLYTNDFTKSYSEHITKVKKTTDANMIALIDVTGIYTDNELEGDDREIAEISSGVFMSYERLFQYIIECELNFDKVFECIKFALRHELGHILDNYNRGIGMSLREWKEGIIEEDKEEEALPKLRKNASADNCLKWYLIYHNLPREKRANAIVGITEEDIINDWLRVKGE